MTIKTPFKDFIAERGNATKLADELNITKGAIAQWQEVPIKRVHAVAAFIGCTPQELRPDFFGEVV